MPIADRCVGGMRDSGGKRPLDGGVGPCSRAWCNSTPPSTDASQKSRMGEASRMRFRGTQERSSGPYPSQSTRYWCPRPRCRTSRRRWTVYAGWLSMTLGGGGGRTVGDNGLVEMGLTWETWKVGCTRRDGGSFNCTAQGLIWGESLGGTPFKGRSFARSQTFCPGAYWGAGRRCLFACN